mmetsp:Transcript_4524/g.11995  ORF Transcript_4524/g.11995 Transcript_4524/m.11995 type:complete len:247 (+) Transcript_4524:69-809(+)
MAAPKSKVDLPKMPVKGPQLMPDGSYSGDREYPEWTMKYFDFFFKGHRGNSLYPKIERTGYYPKQELYDALEKNDPSLTVLDVDNRAFNDDMMYNLMMALKDNTVVTELKLARNISHHTEQGDRFPLALAPILAKSKTITKVDLHQSDMHEKCICALAEALKYNSSVTELNLEDNFVRQNAAELGEMLKVNKTLTSLNCNVNQIQDEAARALLEGLKVSNVKHFTAYNNGIVDRNLRKEFRGFSSK